MSDMTRSASLGRKILSWFVDYLFFSVAWALLTFVTGQILQTGDFLLSLVVFVVLRGILGQIMPTPGRLLLSIDEAGDVDPGIKAHENWLTLTLGVVILLSGCKQLVRWTQIDAVWPYFGVIPGPTLHVAISVILGLASMIAGGLILKLRRAGQWLGLLLGMTYLVSAVLSWRLWDDLVAQQVHARRDAQGLAVRPGEVEFMQALFPEAYIALTAAIIVLLLVPTTRFRA